MTKQSFSSSKQSFSASKQSFSSSKQRCIILIDGSNFYFKLKDLKLHNLLSLNFSGLVKKLAKDSEIVKSIYYVGKIRTDGTKKTKEMHNNQQKLFEHLKKNKISYSLGYLLKSDGRFHEKGVDVNIAVDILVATYENLAERIILVSSDTDLLPAIRKAKEKGKKVEYVGFSHMPSVAMVANCSESTLLKIEDLESFVQKS
ncbi:MAG: NYN domain-containing protein [Candidatus Daviesbacteria bacterium]|nr:NYN domain-containing protein [Candidatus Daviesbacteria bacterium]